MYRALLDVLPRLLVDIDEYRSLWGPADAALTNTEHLFDAGRITIEEQPELDLAVVRGPSAGEWHPMAVHTRTAATRLLLVHGAWIFRTNWNADFGGSGTGISEEVEHRFREVEHGFRKWNIDSGGSGTSVPGVVNARR